MGLLAGSDEVAIVLGSSFGELDVFEEECFRWCLGGPDCCFAIIRAADVWMGREHDRQVHVLRRTISLGPRDKMTMIPYG